MMRKPMKPAMAGGGKIMPKVGKAPAKPKARSREAKIKEIEDTLGESRI